jgi:protein-tyrosine-phosphatase
MECKLGRKSQPFIISAVEVMHEVGIDISSHRSKSIDEFEGQVFDLVVCL